MTAGAAFGQIREALAARLSTNMTGLRAHALVPLALLPPAAVIEGFETAEQDEFNGYRWLVPVTFYVARASERSAQDKLDAYASPGTGGVWEAAQTKPGGGDVIDSAAVVELRDYGEYEANGLMLLGFQALVEVFA